MATTRLMPLHTGKGRTVGTAIADILDYVKNPQKQTTAGSLPAGSVTAVWLTRSSCSPSGSMPRSPAGRGARTM